MAKARVIFEADEKLVKAFKAWAKAQGRTYTWYFVGCMKEIVDRSRREQEEKGGEAVKLAQKRK